MSYEYDKYLSQHLTNVIRGYNWLYSNLQDVLNGISFNDLDVIRTHDQSKFELDEYDAYDNYFYGDSKSKKVNDEFNKAWLLHIHRNPHHWQHWVLINDDSNEGTVCIEMPKHYVIEMICDWWSFSWSKNNLTEIFKWYDEHKKHIQLHPNTRKYVEFVLSQIREKVDES